MSYLNPRPHGQWIQEDYDAAQSQPGTAEFLSSLLTGPDHTCPHVDKTKTKQMPKRLGFFRQIDGTTTYLDTENVCQSCYDQAVPGFNVWSTAYKASAQPVPEEIPARPRVASDYYPLMWEAGTEDDPDAVPVSDRLMPTNAEARELWRYLQETGQPFYVDQLHLTEPWNPNAANQQEEDRRVARENYLAYANASRGFVGTGIGGAGVNSIVEQRILRDRAEELPANFGRSPWMATHDEEPNMTYESPTWTTGMAQIHNGQQREVPTNFPEYFNMPSGGSINREEYEMRGYMTNPTENEHDRRFNLEYDYTPAVSETSIDHVRFQPRFHEDPQYYAGSRQLANNEQVSESDDDDGQNFEMTERGTRVAPDDISEDTDSQDSDDEGDEQGYGSVEQRTRTAPDEYGDEYSDDSDDAGPDEIYDDGEGW